MTPQPEDPLRFLLADDQEEIRVLTTYLLERNGHQVISVTNGGAALREFQHGKFDVVLLDEEMPGLSGVQVVHAIRNQQTSSDPRPLLVALTGNNTPQDCHRLLAEGFDAVLGKPFRLEMLNALSQHSVMPASYGGEPQPANARPATSTMTPLRRVGGDEKLFRKMIRAFLSDSPTRMASLEKALTQKNATVLASGAHALKSSLGLFAAESALKLAQQLQLAARDGDFVAATRLQASLKEEIAKLQENLRRYAEQPKVKPHTKGK